MLEKATKELIISDELKRKVEMIAKNQTVVYLGLIIYASVTYTFYN